MHHYNHKVNISILKRNKKNSIIDRSSQGSFKLGAQALYHSTAPNNPVNHGVGQCKGQRNSEIIETQRNQNSRPESPFPAKPKHIPPNLIRPKSASTRLGLLTKAQRSDPINDLRIPHIRVGGSGEEKLSPKWRDTRIDISFDSLEMSTTLFTIYLLELF